MAGKIFLASKRKKNFIDNLSPYIPRSRGVSDGRKNFFSVET